ncbi:MAG TPA: class I SAM-dependent methyltransferase [Casimicrobiaceae bacterium]|nr:class I SAM-dependent methyltransferase [Casimicrobiaceae bacterium]
MKAKRSPHHELAARTIEDFGEQWTNFSDTSGFFGSSELLADFIQPFDMRKFAGARVADIGAGTGRHIQGLLDAGATEVLAVEPSKAIEVIRRGFAQRPNVRTMNIAGANLPRDSDLDYAISVGVVHHIPEPAPVIRAVYEALKPGGQFVVWLYGKEGNRLYLTLVTPIRWFSRKLPLRALDVLARMLDVPLAAYIAICRRASWPGLPLRDYMVNILGRLPSAKRRLVIYDQLNPHYARYYTRAEAIALMAQAPFEVEAHHRRGYSWVVIGTKPRR